MVTTIKITCDGVFIQSNSYRISGVGSSNNSDNSTPAIDRNNNNTNRISDINNGHNNSDSRVIFNTIVNSNQISYQFNNNINPVNVHQSIAPVRCVSPVNDVAKIIVTAHKTTNNCKPISIRHGNRNAAIASNTNGCSKIRETRIISTTGTTTAIAIRRRNTFKNYFNDCKENLLRRLSSPAPISGQFDNFIRFIFAFHLLNEGNKTFKFFCVYFFSLFLLEIQCLHE